MNIVARTGLWDCVLGVALLGVLGIAGFHMLSAGKSSENRIVEKNGEIHCQMGDVLPGTQVREIVPIWNRSSSTLKIKALAKSCSCLDLALSSETIPPGTKVDLAVTLATPTYRSPFEHRINVIYDSDAKPTSIRFNGTVGAWIQPSESIIDFGEVCNGTSAKRTIDFQIAAPWPRSQSEFSCTLPHTRVDVTADKSETAYHCTLNFDPPANSELGEVNGDLVLRWTGTEGRRLNVQCRANVTPEWTAEPPALALGKVSRGQPVNFSVQLRHRKAAGGGKLPQVTSESNTDFKFQFDASGEVPTIRGTILESGQSPPGLRRAMLVVKDAGGIEVLRIPVYWEFDVPKEKDS